MSDDRLPAKHLSLLATLVDETLARVGYDVAAATEATTTLSPATAGCSTRRPRPTSYATRLNTCWRQTSRDRLSPSYQVNRSSSTSMAVRAATPARRERVPSLWTPRRPNSLVLAAQSALTRGTTPPSTSYSTSDLRAPCSVRASPSGGLDRLADSHPRCLGWQCSNRVGC